MDKYNQSPVNYNEFPTTPISDYTPQFSFPVMNEENAQNLQSQFGSFQNIENQSPIQQSFQTQGNLLPVTPFQRNQLENIGYQQEFETYIPLEFGTPQSNFISPSSPYPSQYQSNINMETQQEFQTTTTMLPPISSTQNPKRKERETNPIQKRQSKNIPSIQRNQFLRQQAIANQQIQPSKRVQSNLQYQRNPLINVTNNGAKTFVAPQKNNEEITKPGEKFQKAFFQIVSKSKISSQWDEYVKNAPNVNIQELRILFISRILDQTCGNTISWMLFFRLVNLEDIPEDFDTQIRTQWNVWDCLEKLYHYFGIQPSEKQWLELSDYFLNSPIIQIVSKKLPSNIYSQMITQNPFYTYGMGLNEYLSSDSILNWMNFVQLMHFYGNTQNLPNALKNTIEGEKLQVLWKNDMKEYVEYSKERKILSKQYYPEQNTLQNIDENILKTISSWIVILRNSGFDSLASYETNQLIKYIIEMNSLGYADVENSFYASITKSLLNSSNPQIQNAYSQRLNAMQGVGKNITSDKDFILSLPWYDILNVKNQDYDSEMILQFIFPIISFLSIAMNSLSTSGKIPLLKFPSIVNSGYANFISNQNFAPNRNINQEENLVISDPMIRELSKVYNQLGIPFQTSFKKWYKAKFGIPEFVSI